MGENFPEAGAVINIDYKRTDGFVVKLTLRDENGTKVLMRLDEAIKKIVELGGSPYEKSFGKPAKPVEYVEGRMCPTCGSKLVYSTTKEGKKFIKCSTNKWNAMTRQPEGCKFVDWLTDMKPVGREISVDDVPLPSEF